MKQLRIGVHNEQGFDNISLPCYFHCDRIYYTIFYESSFGFDYSGDIIIDVYVVYIKEKYK